jgi:HEPN domain-containing protein
MKRATKEWFDLADKDLEVARLLVDNEYVSNAILFRCQQCVEKCLKALLEENHIPVSHIHTVVKLHSLLKEKSPISLSVTEDELDLVDAVYIDSRYPSGMDSCLPGSRPRKTPVNCFE